MKPLLIGQAPGPDNLDPFAGRAGRRLAELACVESIFDFLDCENVLDEWPGSNGKGSLFPLDAARAAADAKRERWAGRDLILAGFAVAKALRLDRHPEYILFCKQRRYFEWQTLSLIPANGDVTSIVVIPHPSGVNQWWNTQKNVKAAGWFLRQLARYGPSAPWRSTPGG